MCAFASSHAHPAQELVSPLGASQNMNALSVHAWQKQKSDEAKDPGNHACPPNLQIQWPENGRQLNRFLWWLRGSILFVFRNFWFGPLAISEDAILRGSSKGRQPYSRSTNLGLR